VELAKFIEERGSDKLTIIAVDWLEGRMGANFEQRERVLRRIIPPSAMAVQGTDDTSRIFGVVESVPTYFLYDAAGRLVLQLGGPREEQSRHRLDRAALDRVIVSR